MLKPRFAVVAYYPLAISDAEEEGNAADVLYVSSSRADAERMRNDIEHRHKLACQEWNEWDVDKSEDWAERHNHKFDELQDKYRIAPLWLANDTIFRVQLVAIGSGADVLSLRDVE